jgi:hypothetical protein
MRAQEESLMKSQRLKAAFVPRRRQSFPTRFSALPKGGGRIMRGLEEATPYARGEADTTKSPMSE